VSIDRAIPFGDPLEDKILRNGGYAIAHIGTVERTDGSTFLLKESEPLLDCLGQSPSVGDLGHTPFYAPRPMDV
jgi:hypothetical protein